MVLAGGLGTRLRSLLPDRPKPMAPIAGSPFLAYLLDDLAAQGVRRVVLSVGYRCAAIMDFFGARFAGMAIDYAIEVEPLGTGGAIARALAMLEGSQGFVLNGDTFLELDYGAMAAAPGDRHMVMALHAVPEVARYGRVVVADGRVQSFFPGGSGAGLVNAGVYLLRADQFERHPMPARFSFEKDFLMPKAGELRPHAFLCEGTFIDIGVPEGYREAQRVLPKIRSGNV